MTALLQVGEARLHEHHGSERAALEGFQSVGLVHVVDLAVLHGALGAVDEDIDAVLVRLGHDVDVGGGVPGGGLAVGPDVVSPFGHVMQFCYLLQQALLNGIHVSVSF